MQKAGLTITAAKTTCIYLITKPVQISEKPKSDHISIIDIDFVAYHISIFFSGLE